MFSISGALTAIGSAVRRVIKAADSSTHGQLRRAKDPLLLGPAFQPSTFIPGGSSKPDAAFGIAYTRNLARGMKRVKIVH